MILSLSSALLCNNVMIVHSHVYSLIVYPDAVCIYFKWSDITVLVIL